jgi:hypothetical protein
MEVRVPVDISTNSCMVKWPEQPLDGTHIRFARDGCQQDEHLYRQEIEPRRQA